MRDLGERLTTWWLLTVGGAGATGLGGGAGGPGFGGPLGAAMTPTVQAMKVMKVVVNCIFAGCDCVGLGGLGIVVEFE